MDPDKDRWELYNIDEDWSQANDLAAKMPEKLGPDEGTLPDRSHEEHALPIGGGLWIPAVPPGAKGGPALYAVDLFGDTVRVPEFSAPALGSRPNVVAIDAAIPANANGVLYKLGGFSGGRTCFVEDGILCYEYNLFEIQRTKFRGGKLPTGKVKVESRRAFRVHAARPAERHHEGERRASC